jgi:phosphoribosylanthranilate isomerase
MEDVLAVVHSGADAVGFQMSCGPRKISKGVARQLTKKLPPWITPVGVLVNESLSTVRMLVRFCNFQVIQLHGQESSEFCSKIHVPILKAIRMEHSQSYQPFREFPIAAFLLDSYNKYQVGGTGRLFNWRWVQTAKKRLPKPIMLAGGLTPGNVRRAIHIGRPFGVDVSSGVEIHPGQKDHRLISLFVKRAQAQFLKMNNG